MKIQYCSDAIHQVIAVLIPKRKGEGFLKSPFGGHHSNKYYWDFMNKMTNERHFKDVSDIDGCAYVSTYLCYYEEGFDKHEENILKALESVFKHVNGFERITRHDFWKKMGV